MFYVSLLVFFLGSFVAFAHAELGTTTTKLLAKPIIITSIKPLALIAQEVAGDRVEVQTLLPVTASPHDYPLKMSDYRRLEAADLVLWIGPELESFLARPLAKFSAEKIMTIYDIAELYWPNADAQVDEKNHTEDEENLHSHLHRHEHKGKDPHLWLDPQNAAIIAHQLAVKFALLKPESAQYFQQNAATFAESLAALDKKIREQLAPIKETGFVVYHEGYAHFVRRYDLHQLAYVVYIPGINLGAKHLVQLREQLKKEKAQCLFGEPGFPAANLETMAKELALKPGLLDPIGNQEGSSYSALIEKLSLAFLDCLADGGDH